MDSLNRFYRELYRESFTEAPKKKEDREVNVCTEVIDRLGYCHFSKVHYKNNDGKIEKIPYDLKTCRTFKTLLYYLEDNLYTWYTPHTLCTSKAYPERTYLRDEKGEIVYNENEEPEYIFRGGRKEMYVRWINSFFVDIDSKNNSIEELLYILQTKNLPIPTVINETQKGYHIYWFLKERVPATPKAKKLYKHILSNIIMALDENISNVDTRITDLCRYMQIPRNIRYANYENKPTMFEFQGWLNTYGKKNYKNSYTNRSGSYNANPSKFNFTIEPIVDKCIDILMKGVKEGNRHEACFVLACCLKAKGLSEVETIERLKYWNENNESNKTRHSEREVYSTVKSVYRSEKNGIPYARLSELTGIKIFSYYKNRKDRKDRTNSHNREWVRDITLYMLSKKKNTITGSQQEIATMFSIPLATFKDMIKEIKEGKYIALGIKVSGRGCYAQTSLILNELLFKKYKSVSKASVFFNHIVTYPNEGSAEGIAYKTFASLSFDAGGRSSPG